jgi:hypothetical protein
LQQWHNNERQPRWKAANGHPGARWCQWASTRSTTKMSASPGLIEPPAPRSP